MKITHFKTLESTNQYLQNLLNEGVDIADNIVVTDFQTSGKGQGKNVWQSEDGKNLLFSIALDMSFLKAEKQFFLTQMVSVAMINVLKKYLPEESLFIKWPNDIYFNDKKIAGILIKNEINSSYWKRLRFWNENNISRLNNPHLLKNEEKFYFIPKYIPPSYIIRAAAPCQKQRNVLYYIHQ